MISLFIDYQGPIGPVGIDDLKFRAAFYLWSRLKKRRSDVWQCGSRARWHGAARSGGIEVD